MAVGIVRTVFGNRCEVLDGRLSLPCLLRGRLKQESFTLAVGDHVEYRRLDQATGVVERVLARRNQLTRSSRERSRRRGTSREQVVLANPDQVVFVAAARDPGIDFALLDRALALARGARLPAAVCVNKMDVAPAEEIRRLLRPYEALGLPILFVSAVDGTGLAELEELLRGRLSFFWGGSGVGKSSLIRALTGEALQVGRWRTDNPRGPHTTNATRLYPLPQGGLIADTPGFDWLELDTLDTRRDRVLVLLPEAAPFEPACRFPACTHCGEPGCAVMAAMLSGQIDVGRYARFRAEEAEREPPPRVPLELLSSEDELFFRMREATTAIWTTFRLHHLFQEERAERQGLLEALGVPPGSGEPVWLVFYRQLLGGKRTVLTAKATAREPLETLVLPGERIVLRERGIVKGVAQADEITPLDTTWRLRKALKNTPIYDSRAFWFDLKPPRGTVLPPVHAGTVTIGHVVAFEPIPELALGALTRQEIGPVLDFLEIGASEDELVR